MLFIILLIISIPLLLILLFKSKYVGTAVVVSGIVFFHAMVGLMLQSVHLFTQSWLVFVHVATAIVIGSVLYKRREQIRKVQITKLPVILTMLIIGIVGYQLYAVHFSYTGIANTTLGEVHVSENAYPYPIFSDEWVAVAIAQTSIDQNALPFTHPFTGKGYQNFLFVFHALVAELGLLFGGVIAMSYVWFGIIINTAIVLLLFVLWRSMGVMLGVATFGALLVPYVVNGSNLPLLWYLLPWNVGFLLFVASLILFLYKEIRWAMVSNFFAVALYPPLIVFSIPVWITVALQSHTKIKKVLMAAVVGFVVGAPLLFTFAISLLTHLSFSESLSRFFSILVRPLNSFFGAVPTFLFWEVLPVLIVPFVVYGIWIGRHEIRFILTPFLLGSLIWSLNPLTDTTFFIDYHRVVAITALLACVIGIVGVQAAWSNWERSITFFSKQNTQVVVSAIFLIIFITLVPGYTAREGWRKYTTSYYDRFGGFQIEEPAAPVNRYLHPDDIRIFSTISNERFLSPGWKGLILGSITSNNPVFTKPSTITMKNIRYGNFLLSTCDEKYQQVIDAGVTYVYTEKINCAKFEVVDQSSEGLYLMRVASL